MPFTEVQWNEELYHFGIKGQKWGTRRFQNEDGTYTQAGLARYFKEANRADKKAEKETSKRLKAQYKQDKKTMGRAAARTKMEAEKLRDQEVRRLTRLDELGRDAISKGNFSGGVKIAAYNEAGRRRVKGMSDADVIAEFGKPRGFGMAKRLDKKAKRNLASKGFEANRIGGEMLVKDLENRIRKKYNKK